MTQDEQTQRDVEQIAQLAVTIYCASKTRWTSVSEAVVQAANIYRGAKREAKGERPR